MAKTVFKNARCFIDGAFVKTDVLIEDEKIIKIEPSINEGNVVDCTGLYLLPGLIDAHTHYRLVSRGTVTADEFYDGSLCALSGGVTTVVDFADHDKTKTLLQSLKFRTSEMKSMAVDYSLHQGVYKVPKDLIEQLREVKKSGVKALKIFTTYREAGYLIEDKKDLEALMKASKELGMLLTAHCEDDKTICEVAKGWKSDYKSLRHPDLRPSVAEATAIRDFGNIAGKMGATLYIVHLSSKEGLEEVRKLRKNGVSIIVETTPTYLFCNSDMLNSPNAPLYIMTPPLRTHSDNIALQEALLNGEIQVVATDHCAFTKEQKMQGRDDCRSAYPGVPGTQEAFYSLFDFTKGDTKKLCKLIPLMSSSPASIFGLKNKGSIKVDYDADFAVFDPKGSFEVNKDTIVSKAGYSLFEGEKFLGRVRQTWLRGRMLYKDGEFWAKEGCGKFIPQA